MSKTRRILGLHVTDRMHHVPGVQNLLTEYGCSTKTRVGLHAVSEDYCSPNGLILLEYDLNRTRRAHACGSFPEKTSLPL